MEDADGGGQHPADLAENMYYKEIDRSEADGERKTGVQAISADSGTLAIAEGAAAVRVDEGGGAREGQGDRTFNKHDQGPSRPCISFPQCAKLAEPLP